MCVLLIYRWKLLETEVGKLVCQRDNLRMMLTSGSGEAQGRGTLCIPVSPPPHCHILLWAASIRSHEGE